MGRYIVRRLVWLVFVLLVITFISFLIFFVMPSKDPAIIFAGRQPTPELVAEVRQQFGLDHPWPVQYGLFVKRIFLGDEFGWPGLGKSFNTRSELKPIIFSRMLVTIQLALGAAVVWLLIGIPIGILSALKPRSVFDRLAMGFALFGVSAPVFFIGPLFLYIFWFKLGVAPGSGYYAIGQYGLGTWFSHFIMPWIVLALLYAAFYARTARAKGLSERTVVLKHGLRASLTPVVTMFGLDIGGLLGGAFITETVFNLPGIGAYAIKSVGSGDLYAILDITIIAGFFITFMNLVVDVLYAFLDPRVRYT